MYSFLKLFVAGLGLQRLQTVLQGNQVPLKQHDMSAAEQLGGQLMQPCTPSGKPNQYWRIVTALVYGIRDVSSKMRIGARGRCVCLHA
jgi:hypothetical protein